MKETYRKRGTSVRWENGTLVRVTESGEAIEENGVFRAAPASGRSRAGDRLEAGAARELAERVEGLIPKTVRIERLISTHGIAEHECNGKTWTEETQRIHLSLVRGRIRALVDHVDDVQTVAEALARCDDDTDRPTPALLRLAPAVTAALLPSLVGLAPPNVELWQTAGGIDGKGNAIEETRGPWTNWYRPSYRIRPVRMPLNLRLDCEVQEIDRDRPVAVAILAPVEGLLLRVLIDDGERCWPATVRVTRIDAVGPPVRWYPYGGGSFGAEMML